MRALPWLVGVVVILAVYLSWTAGRLDRLNARVDAARAALDAQLVRRSSVSLEIATCGLLDPATALLLAAVAHEAREVGPDDQELAESDLSHALRAVLDQPGQHEQLSATPEGTLLLHELDGASRRVVMARRFHNDAVRATRAVRRKRVVRYLRLAGRGPLPATFESDDEPPRCLAREL